MEKLGRDTPPEIDSSEEDEQLAKVSRVDSNTVGGNQANRGLDNPPVHDPLRVSVFGHNIYGGFYE